MSFLALDTETTGSDLHHGCLPFFVTICDEDLNSTIWQWRVNPHTRLPEIPSGDREQIIETVQGHELVLHNAKFDIRALDRIGVSLPEIVGWDNINDTWPASHAVQSGGRHGLKNLCVRYLGFLDDDELELGYYTKMAQRYGRSKKRGWDVARARHPHFPAVRKFNKRSPSWKFDMWMPREAAFHINPEMSPDHPKCPYDPSLDPTVCHPFWWVLRRYAVSDGERTMELWQYLRERLSELDLWESYELNRRLLEVTYDMEERGVSIRRKTLREERMRYSRSVSLYETKAVEISGNPDLNVRSGPQLQKVLYEDFKLPVLIETDGGEPSTSADALIALINETEDPKTKEFILDLLISRKFEKGISYLESYAWSLVNDAVHTVYLITGTDVTRTASLDPNVQNVCVDGDTEILTTEGWTRADQLTAQHTVAQYWKDTTEIDFTVPTEVYAVPYTGNMVHIQTEEQIDLLLTPAHRCLLKHRHTGTLKDFRADHFPEDYQHFHAGQFIGGTESFTEAQVQWLCAVQADGSYRNDEYGITFAFKKQRKIERLRKCLVALGVRYSCYERGSVTTFYVPTRDQDIVQWTKELMPEKCFGAWLLSLDRPTLDRFDQELWYWDGDFTRRAVYSSKDRRNVDWVQILYTLLGKRSNLVSRTPQTAYGTNEHHYLNVTHRTDKSITTNRSKVLVPWDGLVYCVTVPSSYIIVRRNGKVSITGNSKGGKTKDDWPDELIEALHAAGLNLRKVFGPREGRIWVAIDFQQLHPRIFAWKSNDEQAMAAFRNGVDFYKFIAKGLFGVESEDLITKEQRAVGKMVNLADMYGVGEGKLRRSTGMLNVKAKMAEAFPLRGSFIQKLEQEASEGGFVTTTSGYRIYCKDPHKIVNYRIIGDEGIIAKKAMLSCFEYLKTVQSSIYDPYMNLMVHDELVFDFPADDMPRNMYHVRHLCDLMEAAGASLGVETPVEATLITESWDKGRKLKREEIYEPA